MDKGIIGGIVFYKHISSSFLIHCLTLKAFNLNINRQHFEIHVLFSFV